MNQNAINLKRSFYKFFLFIATLFLSFIIISCSYQQIKDQNLSRPQFENQKTLLLEQNLFEFGTNYTIWNRHPVDFTEFRTFNEIKKAMDYEIKQKLTWAQKYFIINDNLKKSEFVLKQEDYPQGKISIYYSIYKGNEKIADIQQTDPDNIMKYQFLYNEKTYTYEGKVKGINQDVHSFVFELNNNENKLGIIFKQFGYFKNQYEIIINEKIRELDPVFLVILTVFTDQVLKENGFQYK